MKRSLYSFLALLVLSIVGSAQVSVGTAVSFGLRKINPAYSGNAIEVRRTCDNGSTNIPFTSCGDMDTVALKAFVVAANPLSAMTITSTTAYSLRRLRCSYTGPAICVRSSAVGNPTLDIGFTANGDLDTTSLKTFIGANSAFVTTWYDQSGNGYNASQATAGNQPRIVNAGVIDRQGARPAIRWLGNGYNLSTAAFTAYSSAACFNGVARVSTNVTYNTIINKSTSNYPAPLDFYNSQMVIGAGSSYNFFGYGQTFNATLPHSIWTYNASSGGSYNFYYNGGLTATGAVGFYGDLGTPLILGSRADGMTGLNGWISESITFNTIPSTTDRQFMEWSQAQYYGINGPVLSTLPVAPASGFVSTWYDQSGNAKHVLQTTSANQPVIIQTGSIEKINGLPAISFNGTSHSLSASDAGLPTGDLSITGIVRATSLATYGGFLHYGNNGNGNAVFASFGSDGNFGTNAIGLSQFGDAVGIANSIGSSIIFSSLRSATNYSVFRNGTNLASKTMVTNTSLFGASGLSIGAFNPGTGGGFLNGLISELSLFSSALSVTRRILLQTNYSAYTNIAVTNSKYTPPSAGSYHRFVNGVGRESATDSVAGTRSTVGMGIQIGQSGTDYLKDNGDYITYGIDCPITSTTSTANLPGTVVARWLNDWYLQKTDVSTNNGNVTIFFDFSDYGIASVPGTASNYELLARTSPASNFTVVSVTTKNVTGDRVLFTTDAANLPNNFYYTIGSQNISASPLPVELLSFDVNCEGSEVITTWVTAVQRDNDFFSVERTTDGKNFETIGKVKGAGTTQERKNYTFTDAYPINGVSYYRLKQTDYNGAETSYNYREIICDISNEKPALFPNPADETFSLSGIRFFSDMIIYNSLGQPIVEKQNVLPGERIDAGLMPEGVYFVHLTERGKPILLKLIIIH